MTGRWLADLGLGARMALSGGREGRLRAGLAAIGVGLGVALLTLATAVPGMLDGRNERAAHRALPISAGVPDVAPGDTLLVAPDDLVFRDQQIFGVRVHPESPAAPTPPGVVTLPGPGELVVSPALARLLRSTDGELLRPRLDHPIVGTIGDEGLRGPRELAFYLGDEALSREQAQRVDRFGRPPTDPEHNLRHPVVRFVLTVGVVLLLLPVVMFVAVAVRFGGEHRDRRLAALRLVGADAGMTRRIAAGEALVGALLGLVAGAVLFLAGRQLVEYVMVWDLSLFAVDVRPNPLLVAPVMVAVPVLAVLVTLAAMRRLVVEPLGVVRRAGPPRRRLWWRLVPPATGVALLYPLIGQLGGADARINPYQLGSGVVLVLVGVALLLPWLVDQVVRRLRGGGSVSWQLAIRRLQLSGGSTGRVVNGTAVAVAGAIALQMLLAATQQDLTGVDPYLRDHPDEVEARLFEDAGGIDTARVEAVVDRFAATTGVRSATGVARLAATTEPEGGEVWYELAIGGCPALRELAEIDECTDGDVFLAAARPAGASDPDRPGLAPGQPLRPEAVAPDDDPRQWTVPADAQLVTGRPGRAAARLPEVLVTPDAAGDLAAVNLTVRITVDAADPDAVEHVRNTAAGIDWTIQVSGNEAVREEPRFTPVRRGLLVGVAATLVMIGLSLLVGMVEQLRERRRLLAVLVAFGTRRRTLGWSVLWQTAIPMTLGVLLAVGAGLGLGALLLAIVELPIQIDAANVAAVAGIAAAVVLLVTVLALPLLWRLMRPAGLRAE